MKILSSGDWHILLHKKKVPIDWQANRFRMFFDKIHELEKECDIHIIAGDIFDRAPKLDEVTLFQRFANSASIRTIIIPGNHEATKKGKSFLNHFFEKNAITNPNIEIYTKNTIIEHMRVKFQLFPYTEMQIDNLPIPKSNSILVTHIRGEVPPHITEEYDFEKLRPWNLILLGDLHFNHRYKDFPAYYPGSPMNISFDRNENREYGVNIIDFKSTIDYEVRFLSMELPKLIRRTVKATEATNLEKHSFNHIIYEVTGSLDEVAKVEKTDLIDKVISYKPLEDSVLNLTEVTSLNDELKLYLKHSKIENIDKVMKEFINLNIQ